MRKPLYALEQMLRLCCLIWLLAQLLPAGYAQASIPARCSVDVLSETDSRGDSLEFATVQRFWLTFDESCQLNVEYSEWSNELAFRVLAAAPALSLRAMEHHEIQFAYILRQLEAPLLDPNLDALYDTVANAETDDEEIRRHVLGALERGTVESRAP